MAKPLVTSHRESNTQRIAGLDARAETLRLRPGMGIAEARAMHPDIDVVEADPEADRRLLEGLADWCDRYTPLVAIDGENGLFLDITGCAHLFGGEKALLADLMARFFHQGFDVRAGLASTPGAAWAAARFATGHILAPGSERNFFARLPLAALRIDARTKASLESVGLRTVGAIMDGPRAPLVRRFGTELIERLDQALGRLDEAISPRLPVAALSVERHFADPLSLIDDIERLIGLLAATLKVDLERREEGARALELLLFRVDGMVSRITVGASRPIREPTLVRRLFHERLATLGEGIDAGYGFDLVRLSALSTARFDARQGDLAGEVEDGGEELAIFADRIGARLGEAAVLEPATVESHLPERAAPVRPYAQEEARKGLAGRPKREVRQAGGRPRQADRPIRLFRQPEPIDVPATEIPDGPPLNFRWRRALHRVARAEGPERIAPEWWREDADAPTRDYYRIEDAEGRRYWLYRQGLYSAKAVPRWFLHGVFA
ncbi:Y-family DNA polymerase [Aminobacter carboxidus]|uniref:Y-family DNA polymerase n=1 Tax=Aminobacter carboxidus TaxID=376165 RepID=UPI001FE4F3CB|nr:DNA polymerase Y family protein [Aminobacter carboxidus]